MVIVFSRLEHASTLPERVPVGRRWWRACVLDDGLSIFARLEVLSCVVLQAGVWRVTEVHGLTVALRMHFESRDRCRKAKSSHLEPGDWRPGDWRLESGVSKLETGDWRLESGDWRLETGDIQRASRHPRTGLDIQARHRHPGRDSTSRTGLGIQDASRHPRTGLDGRLHAVTYTHVHTHARRNTARVSSSGGAFVILGGRLSP